MTLLATRTTSVWVFGARGMLAGEFLRLIENHPGLQLAGAVSRSDSGLAEAHPHATLGLPAVDEDRATEGLIEALAAGESCAAVLALPHGESAALYARLEAALGSRISELAVVDLAADFRLRDPGRYENVYGRSHPCPDALADFVYGLPELDRSRLSGARRVAAPGCFATALQLAAVPAARAGLLDATRPWIFTGVTGSSGSGATPAVGTHHPWRHGNLWAYGLDGHRHEAELLQALAPLGVEPPVHFVPHSGPFARGIHLTAMLPLARAVRGTEVRAAYVGAYGGEPFVEVLAERVPDLRSVVGSNRATLGLHLRGSVLTVLCTIDNMIKGGAGQALQCLNAMLGFPETCGLPRAGLGVV
jgi:N-acetyl-gamma-glutamyl-phosphate/LysW-gamma-L-alpha-aminoadipyl-6-phosphate reductase